MTTPAAPLTDAELIARTRGGDMSSYDALYRRHVDDARRVARIVTDNSDEADDVVAEAFTRVLSRLQAGGGPDEELTPYLRTVVRRLAIDRYRATRRDGLPADPAVLEVLPEPDDPMARATDREMVRQAFETLPERWQRVLWHTEIEGRSPAALAATLGATPNAVAALAYRAREGLRQAYLSVHLSSSIPDECRPYVPKLAAYVRGTLSASDDRWVGAHLDVCDRCRERRDELLLLVADLRSVLWPALLAPVAVVGGGGVAAAAAGAATGVVGAASGAAGAATGIGRWWARIPRPKSAGQVAASSVTVAAAAAVVAASIAIGNSDGQPREQPIAAPSAQSTSQPRSASPSPTPTPVVTPSPTPQALDPPPPPPAVFVPPEPELEPGVAVTPAPEPAKPPKSTVESDKSPKHPKHPPHPTPLPGPAHPPWLWCQLFPWWDGC